MIEEKLAEYGMPLTHEDMEYIEHRAYNDIVATADMDIRDSNSTKEDKKRSWNPYEQDLTHYPEVFKKYGQDNYEAYEKMRERFENEKPFREGGESPVDRKLPRDMSPWEKREADLLPRFQGTSCQ